MKRMIEHAELDYPREAVGALIGLVNDGTYSVMDAVELQNEETESPTKRFLLSPMQVLKAEKLATERQQIIIGWYHSHPESRPSPTETDRNAAWPFFVYPIISVFDGKAGEVKCWRLAEDGQSFRPVDVIDN